MQSTRMYKEKPKKPKGVKHMTFVIDKVMEETTPSNYNKRKSATLGSGNEPTKPSSFPQERMSKRYSFKRDKVLKICKDALNVGLQLPKNKWSEEAYEKDYSKFCPCYRILGHSIENCYVIKDWID